MGNQAREPHAIRRVLAEERQHRRDHRSPDHAVFVDDVLVPPRPPIIREPADEVTYYHLELPDHDVVLAEGPWCESDLNTGDGSAFANGGGTVASHPDFTALRGNSLPARTRCLLFGPRRTAIQRRLTGSTTLRRRQKSTASVRLSR